MREAPRLRGGPTVRLTSLFFGLVLLGVAIVCLLESRLGLAPWDVFHLGVARHSPLAIGAASVVVALAVLFVAWALGQPPGFGTVANAIVIGVVVDLLLSLSWVVALSDRSLPLRGFLLVLGVALFGVGSACYIGAGFGAGPRDSLMLVLSRRTGVRIAVVRATIELTVIAVGWMLGGTVGVGTVAVAFLLGPSVEGSFWLFIRAGLAKPGVPVLEVVAGTAPELAG
jgi:uncharacterized membrane protein YczE